MTHRSTAGSTGLYDPAYEHDACGVAFVADLPVAEPRDRGQGPQRAAQPRAPRRPGAEPDTGDGAGILIQVPDAFLREVVGFELPAPGAYAVGIAFLPADDGERRGQGHGRHRADRRRGGPARPRLARRARSTPRRSARPRRGGDAALPPAVPRRAPAGRDGGIGARPAGLLSCASAPSTSSRPSVLLPVAVSRTLVYKGMLTTDQLERVLPRPARRARRVAHRASCTPGSPPTPSRRGRWRTRTATSPTTARSTPSRATATGCAPARRCSPATASPATSSGCSRSARPARQRLGVLRRGARAAAPRRPLAAARGADDDPGGVGEPRRRWTRRAGRSTSSTPR